MAAKVGIEFTLDHAELAKARGHLALWRGLPLDRTLRAASLRGARALRAPLRSAAPVGTNVPRDYPRNLRGSVKIARLKDRTGYAVGPMGKKAFHRYWVVGGTRPHTIAAKSSRGLSTPYGVFRRVRHGAIANPFVARVGNAERGAVRAAMLAHIRQEANKR